VISENVSEVTGNKTAPRPDEDSADNSNVIEIKRLAGL
jgi:hypothetical protein